jgi:hypothetical protein
MNLIALPAFEDNYLWLLHDDARALVVDPGDAQPVQAALARLGLQLQGILVTHHHGDHTGGVAVLREATGAAVYGPAGERIPEPHHALRGGQGVSVLGIDWQVIDVPGHTAGHIAYYAPDVDGTPLLFCGDTLFSGGCGRLFEARRRRCWPRSTRWRRCRPPRGCAARTSTPWPTCALPSPSSPATRRWPTTPASASGGAPRAAHPAVRHWHRAGHQPLPAQPPAGGGTGRAGAHAVRPRRSRGVCRPSRMEEHVPMKLLHVLALGACVWLAGCARRPRKPAAAPRHARHTHGGCHPCRPAGCHARGGRDRTAQLQVAPLAAPADLWDRIRRGFAMPNLDSDLVRKQQQWYLSRPDYIERMVERSRLYLFHVVEELELRGMPTELALLPYIESAFNPQAVSSAKAAGLWQFMPGTGRDQLKQNVLRDERRSVLDSTRAALDYLQMLHDMFGDWHLALAAYNWGQGNVSKAIERNKAAGLPTGYLDLNMPAETRNYVPKLQAVKNIIANPTLFGACCPTSATTRSSTPWTSRATSTSRWPRAWPRCAGRPRRSTLAAQAHHLAAGTPRSCCPGTTPPSSRRTWPPPTRHAGLVDGLGGTQHHGHARCGPAGEHGRGRAARTQRRAARHADPAGSTLVVPATENPVRRGAPGGGQRAPGAGARGRPAPRHGARAPRRHHCPGGRALRPAGRHGGRMEQDPCQRRPEAGSRVVVVYLPVRAGRSAAASPRATAKAAPRRAAQQHTQRRASPAKATHKAAASKTSSKKRR